MYRFVDVEISLLFTWPHLQEFNLEKLQLVEQEKAKIRKEYERREGQVEVKKKMCVGGICFDGSICVIY